MTFLRKRRTAASCGSLPVVLLTHSSRALPSRAGATARAILWCSVNWAIAALPQIDVLKADSVKPPGRSSIQPTPVSAPPIPDQAFRVLFSPQRPGQVRSLRFLPDCLPARFAKKRGLGDRLGTSQGRSHKGIVPVPCQMYPVGGLKNRHADQLGAKGLGRLPPGTTRRVAPVPLADIPSRKPTNRPKPTTSGDRRGATKTLHQVRPRLFGWGYCTSRCKAHTARHEDERDFWAALLELLDDEVKRRRGTEPPSGPGAFIVDEDEADGER
jgi:hypothetical protein